MNETHQFLRYVVPAASFSIEAIFFLLLLLPEWTMTKFSALAKAEVGSTLLAFLGMGGLGFLFSTLHHLSRECEILGGADSRSVISRLRNKKALQLFQAGTDIIVSDEKRPNRRQAWVIVNAIWHQMVSVNPKIKGSNPRAQTLADIVHSIGAAQWGALFASFTPFVVACFVAVPSSEIKDILRSVGVFILSVFFVYIHHLAYRQTSFTAEHFIAEILEDALTVDCSKPGMPPVRTYVDF